MKVLIFGHKIFNMDMRWGFLQAGCDAQIINAVTANQMDRILGDLNPDLLVTLGAPLEFKHEVLDVIGNRPPSHMKYVHWDTDGISSQYFQSESGEGIEMDLIYRSKPDLVLTICPEMFNLIRSNNFACEIMHFAYCPLSHYPVKHIYETDMGKYYINIVGCSYIMLVNTHPEHFRYVSLGILLKPLLEHGYPVHFYGDRGYQSIIKTLLNIDVPSQYFHGYMPYERTNQVYNSSFINLVTQNHTQTVTKRTFEILGAGGFVLSSDNTGIRELFTPGRDLAVSSSPEQTLELVEYYKSHPNEYWQIRENAATSVQNHTYKQRAEFILSKVAQLQ